MNCENEECNVFESIYIHHKVCFHTSRIINWIWNHYHVIWKNDLFFYWSIEHFFGFYCCVIKQRIYFGSKSDNVNAPLSVIFEQALSENKYNEFWGDKSVYSDLLSNIICNYRNTLSMYKIVKHPVTYFTCKNKK